MAPLTPERRLRIINLSSQGYSTNNIARIVGCNRTTVRRWATRSTVSSLSRRIGARQSRRAASPEQMSQIRDILQAHPHRGSRRLLHIVRQDTGLTITDRTIRNYAAAMEFRWGAPSYKPLLTPIQHRKRLQFARAHRNEDWSHWIFSDEKTFQLTPSRIGVRYVPGSRPVVGRSAYRRKVNVWWAISISDRFEPEIFIGNLDKERYIDILSRRLPRRSRVPWKFQQDNAPAHKARITKHWLDTNLNDWEKEWPSNSPDLNPIENIWALVSRYVYEVPINTVEELESRVREGINTISHDTIKNTINSMNDRLAEVITNNGGNTRY